MKLLKLAALLVAVNLTAGCATNSDIRDLQGQINGLKMDIAASNDEINRKLDRMFRSSMTK